MHDIDGANEVTQGANDNSIENFGNMLMAYTRFCISPLPPMNFDDIEKLTDDGVCCVCYREHRPVYNICQNKHNVGCCIDCIAHFEQFKCPVCN